MTEQIRPEEFAAIVRMLRAYEFDDLFFNPIEADATRKIARAALKKLEAATASRQSEVSQT